jgi:hypothetical protein
MTVLGLAAVVAIRERDEALLRAGKAEGEAESLRQQLAGAVTDEMCAAALKAERSQRWNSDELRVWAMLAAARDARGAQQ